MARSSSDIVCGYLLRKHRLLIDPRTARELVLAVRTVMPVEEEFGCEVRGRRDGRVAAVVVTRGEVRSVLRSN